MARMLCLLVVTTVTAATASCAEPRPAQAQLSADPAWFQERVAEARASNRRYPRAADVPAYQPETTSYEAWREGVADMAEVREALLSDPNLVDVDAAAPAADDFAERSRADAARDIERQSVED